MIQHLLDQAEVTDLLTKLNRAVDEHDFAAIEHLFTEDATADTPGGSIQGRAALIAQATRNHEDYDRLHHHAGGVLVEIDGDRAKLRATVVATFARSTDEEPERQSGIVYENTAVRTPDGWRFDKLGIRGVWVRRTQQAEPAAAGTRGLVSAQR